MGELLKLVEVIVSNETIEALEYVLSEAKAGRVVGFAAVFVHRSGRYTCDAVGQAVKAPTFTRGAVNVLDDQLASLVARVRR